MKNTLYVLHKYFAEPKGAARKVMAKQHVYLHWYNTDWLPTDITSESAVHFR